MLYVCIAPELFVVPGKRTERCRSFFFVVVLVRAACGACEASSIPSEGEGYIHRVLILIGSTVSCVDFDWLNRAIHSASTDRMRRSLEACPAYCRE